MTNEELIQTAKFVLSRCPKIKNKEDYNDCVSMLSSYFYDLINKYDKPERKITKKILIYMGLKEMAPRKPFKISNRISIKPSDDGSYSI